MKLVIALGGNAIIRSGEKGTYREQLKNISETVEVLADLVLAGHQLAITHGNGPQVGNLLIQHEAGKDKVPPLPLDVCGAQSQGQLGYLIQQQLQNKLSQKKSKQQVASVITQVLVDEDDPAFKNPSKPVGPFYDEEWAKAAKNDGTHVVEDAGRGWRKVVASPKPQRIVELSTIKTLYESGIIVICGGGGGVPVVQSDKGLKGVEAVIDKDRVGSLLAQSLQADLYVILTDVSHVAINFNTPQQKQLSQLSIKEAQTYLDKGEFGTGSMAPKVEAAVEFTKKTQNSTLITNSENLTLALDKKSGTWIS